MRVKFLRDEIYETEGRLKGPRYTAGKEYDLPDDQAHRWLRRGAAEEVVRATSGVAAEQKQVEPVRPPEVNKAAVVQPPAAAPTAVAARQPEAAQSDQPKR